MEIGGVAEKRYTPATLGSKKTEGATKEERNLARMIQDTLRISQEGRDKAHEASSLSWLDEQIKSANDQAEAKAKELKIMSNCQKIAARLMRGDKVDPKDLQYLMEHDDKGYQLAMALRKPKKDPEESKRITEDEEEKTPSAESADRAAGGISGGESADVGGGGETVAAGDGADT